MSNANRSSRLFIWFMVVSSYVLIYKADASKETARFRRRHLHGSSSFVDNSWKSMNKPPPPLEGVQPITKDVEFSYSKGTPSGPENWGTLRPDWKICADGKSQSPINIDSKQARVKTSDLKRAYNMGAPAKLINGHNNIGVEWLGDAGGIELNGSTYKLQQCHWHIPAEHTIDGKRFDIELHLVHENDMGHKTVISILKTIGQPSPFIESILEKIKMLSKKDVIDLGKISASNISHGIKRHYRYMGSFTTPPCSEGVIWTITEKDKAVSQDQINLLKGLHRLGFQENARPLQQLGGRPLWQFDSPEEKE